MKFSPIRKNPKARNHWLDNHAHSFYDTNQFSFVDDSKRVKQMPTPKKYTRHDTHTIDTIASSNTKTVFRSYKYLPEEFYIGAVQVGFYSPQGIVVSPNGMYAYVFYNSSSSNDDKFGKQQVEILKINMLAKGHVVGKDDDTSVGMPFLGGHGQAILRNPRTGQIWNVRTTHEGNFNSGWVQKIDRKLLRPAYEIHFDFSRYNALLGDDIVMDEHNHVYNFERPSGRNYLTIYKGSLGYPMGFHMDKIAQRIKVSPAQIIQDTSYNPHNGRIYIASDNQITSFPAHKVGHLAPTDFRQVTFDSNRECEGLSFEANGTAYLLMSRSPEILRCDHIGI